MNSTTTRRTQTRSTPRAHISRRRQRSRSPDPAIIRPSTLSTQPDRRLSPSPIPLQSTLARRSKKRENQNPVNSSTIYNSTRSNQNEMDIGPVAGGDKSKAKALNSKSRSATYQSTENLSSARTAVVQGRRDRDRSLTRGESGRSSKPASSAEPIEADYNPQFTGAIAVAQYMRLQNEVDKLREVHSHHVMIDAIYFGFTRSQ